MRYRVSATALALLAAAACTSPQDSGLRFAVSFPQAKSSTPLDGHVVLLLSKDASQEPRKHVAENEALASPYLFGVNVDALAPGQAAVFDDHAFGWPAGR